MSDSTVHDPSPDDLFRNRIAAALGRLDIPESDAEIDAALDAVDPEPISSATSERILKSVHQAVVASSNNGVPYVSATRPLQRSDVAHRTRNTVQTASQTFIVVGCLALLMLTGLLYSRLPSGRSNIANRGSEPLSNQLIATEHGTSVTNRTEVTVKVTTGDTITTGPREKRRFSLPDGSILSMNEKTTVTVTGLRRIKLESGEIFVEVIPADLVTMDPPAEGHGRFVVETAGRQVTALGTKFVVKANDQSTNVVVTQGKVQVSGVGPVIAAGQELIADVLDASSVQVRPARRSAYVVQWVKDLMAAANSFVVPTSQHSGGSITVVDPQGQEMKLSLRKFHVDVHIEDGFARTTIDQTYFNHTWQQLEGTFRFPLPADASLSRLAMYVNGTLMEGGMVERDYGRNVFEEIRHTRRDPALLEWVDGSTFQMRVFPLEARQEKRILLSYTQRLPGEYGKSYYRFPVGHNLEGVRDWSTHVRVKRGAGTKWYSPSHLLDAKVDGSDLIIDGQEQYAAFDRDLILELGEETPAGSQVADPVWSRFEQDGFQYLMFRLRPELQQTATPPRRHWIFLFENSADRNTVLAETQRQVARVLLENCEHRDLFSIVRAGTQPDLFHRAPVECSLDNVSAAVDFLKEVAPIGALDLGQALQSIQQLADSGTETYVVHLGSGIPVLGERDQTTLIRQLPAKARYVGVAVGKRWSKSFMETAAKQTGGLVVQINPDEAVAWRAFDLLSTLNAPRLTEIRVTNSAARPQSSDPAAAGPEFLPLMTSVSHGQEFLAVARLPIDQALPGSVEISGKMDGKVFSQSVAVPGSLKVDAGQTAGGSASQNEKALSSGHLPRTWARLEIDRLVSMGSVENKARIIELSKSMYVMSPFTSLLVLETEAMYAQYKVDRGRKDHWAMYGAPAQIPVVAEPAPVQMTILDAAKERLTQAKGRVQSAGKNLERGISDGRPATDIKRLERVQQSELRDVKFLEEEIRRIEQANAAAEDPVRKAWASVIQRNAIWQLGYIRPLYSYRQVPLGWSDATLQWDDGQWNKMYRTPNSQWGMRNNTYWYGWGESSQRFGEPNLARARNQLSIRGGMMPPGPMINGPGPGVLQMMTADGEGVGGDGVEDFRMFFNSLSFEASDRSGEDVSDFELLGDNIQYRQERVHGWPVYSVPIGQRSDVRLSPDQSEDRFFKRRLNEFNENRRRSAFNRSNGITVSSSLDRLATFNGLNPSSRGIREDQFGGGGFGSVAFPWQLSQAGPALEGISRQRFGTPGLLLKSMQVFGEMDFDSDSLIDLSAETDGFIPLQPVNASLRGLNTNSYRYITPEYQNGRLNNSGNGIWYGTPFGNVAVRTALHPLTRVIKDLPSYAPGLQTWMSDRWAVAESAATTAPKTCIVDATAKQLIEKARSRPWQSIRLISVNGKPVLHNETVIADGSGRFRVDREVSEGLKETVIHDGTTLWHLYPEIGLGARRNNSRFYQPAIQSLNPWYVPPVEVLALHADITVTGQRTVRIQPTTPKDAGLKNSEEHSDSGSGNKSDPDTMSVGSVELVFEDDGRLTELRLIDSARNEVVSRQTLSADGFIRYWGTGDTPVAEAQYELAFADAPDLAPDKKDLVVLPLPYRSATTVGVDVPLNLQNNTPDFARLSDDDALKLLATYFAEARQTELPNFVEQRFRGSGDKRIGFAVLVASVAYSNMVPNSTNPYPNVPLTRFLEQAATLVPSGNCNGQMDAGSDAPPFLKRLCGAYNHYCRWVSGRADASERADADVEQELKQTLQYVSECRSLELAGTLLSAVHQRLIASGRMKPVYARMLNATAGAIATSRDIPTFARSARIEWSLITGTAESEAEAKNLFLAHLLDAVDAGHAPYLEREVRSAFAKHFHTPDGQSCQQWVNLVREVAKTMSTKDRPMSLSNMAYQCVDLNELALASEIIQLAISDQDLKAKPNLNLAALEYAKHAKDWNLAESCVKRALDTPAYQRDSQLWRNSARIAHEQKKFGEWIEHLEKAYEIEFADLPKTVNLELFRQDYQSLFEQFEERTTQLVEGTAEERKSFAMIIQRSANRWREIDSDDTNVCQRTARMLTRLGQSSAAWNYWTTPLAETPDQSSAWTAFAAAMQSENRFAMADKAWITAASCEPTNPEILLQHAQFLRMTRQETRAQALLKAIITGTWQPRFAGTKAQAQTLLSGQEPSK